MIIDSETPSPNHLNTQEDYQDKKVPRVSMAEKQKVQFNVIQKACIKYLSNGKYCTEHEIVIRHFQSLSYRSSYFSKEESKLANISYAILF